MPVLTTGSESVTTTPVISRALWDDIKDWIDDHFGGNSGGGRGNGGQSSGGRGNNNNGDNDNGNGRGNNNGSSTRNNGGGSGSTSTRQTSQRPTSTSTRSSNAPTRTSSSTRQTNNNNGAGGGGGGGQETSSSSSSNNRSNNGSGRGNNTSSSNNLVAPSTSSADSKPTSSSPSPAPGVVLPTEASQNTVPSTDPASQSTVTDSSNQQPRKSSVNIIAIILPIVLVVAAAAAAFFFIWHKKRRGRPDRTSISINSNPPSVLDLHGPASNAPTVGDPSARSSAVLLPPRSAGMAQTADSRPVSMSSSAFGITNPFAGHAGTPYGSDAGHSVPYGHSTLNIASHSPSASVNGSIVGSAMFSTTSAQHGHAGSTSTPASEAANPFGDQARLATVPGNQMRLVNPSTDDITSQDAHIGYGAALASSVGHGLHSGYHDDGRSILSSETVRTPTSLFFKPERSSLLMSKAFPMPPQHPTIPASPISPPTPSSAAPLLGDDAAPIPAWLRSGAPSPPPKGPLPAPPSRASTYASTRLTEWDAYDGIEPEPLPVAFVQMAQRAPVQAPVMVSAPPAAQLRSHTPTMNSQLRRSPSVLTSGSDDDPYRPQ